MTESTPEPINPPENKAEQPKSGFKLPSRVSPTVSFEKNLFGTAKPPQDLLFGRLSQPDSFQYQTSVLDQVNNTNQETKVAVKPSEVQESKQSNPTNAVDNSADRAAMVAWLLAVMLFLVGAAGSPGVHPLADTVKSAIVAVMALLALTVYFWKHRHSEHSVSVPTIIAVPALLCAYALGSTIWSHAYLGSVEAIRYFIWIVLIFLACYVARDRRHLAKLLWGVHLGGLAASFIGAMQFWLDVQWFAQGPNPASTFVNRNFAAEYVVMTLPIGAYLLWREVKLWRVLFLTLSSALAVVFLMQTGTRSALIAFAIMLPLLSAIALVLRNSDRAYIQTKMHALAIAGAFLVIVAALGSIPTNNKALLTEFNTSNHSPTAIGRAYFRYGSIQASDGSLSVRTRMWQQTFRMFNDKPVFGVGAGAWEVVVPKYQPENELVELDYYAHNEYLQLFAEYGLLGLLCIASVLAYLGIIGWQLVQRAYQNRRWKNSAEQNDQEVDHHETLGLIICLMCSAIALGVVSLAGFPWRLAATGSLIAIVIGLLAGLSARTFAGHKQGLIREIKMPPHASGVFAAISLVGLTLALHISNEARLAEKHIMRALSLSIGINLSAPPEMQARMRATHLEAVNQIKLGIAKNPHYRKVTALVAEKLASIGDWSNAAFVYDSLIESRPYIPLLLHNGAIVHERLRNHAKQLDYAERALQLRPRYMTARSLELHALLGLNRHLEALGRGRTYLADGLLDDVGIVATFKAAIATQDFKYALDVLAVRMERVPTTKVDSLLSAGNIQFKHLKNTEAAVAAFKEAWVLSDKGTSVIAAIPTELINQIKGQ